MSRRPYVRPISAREWIFRHPRYVRYMVREFSCLFIAGWTLLMVWGLKQLADGPAAWAAFLELVEDPSERRIPRGDAGIRGVSQRHLVQPHAEGAALAGR